MRLVNHPVLCNYYLTYKCNAKCSFCDIWEQPSQYASLARIQKNFKDLKELGVKVIDFTGGEPLLHPDLPEILSIAKSLRFITTITTNGLLYPKKAKSLAGLIDMLHFSLDSSNADQHNTMRGIACFQAVMESIDIAKGLGEKPDILFTVFKGNFDQIEPVYRQIVLPNNLLMILNPAFEYNGLGVDDSLSEKQLRDLRIWGKKKRIYLNDAFIELRKNGGNSTSNPVCKAASSTLVISPDNALVLPCYHLNKESIAINDNLKELYASPNIKKRIDLEGKLPECEGCTINCYMQPSFTVELNKYWLKALPSTLKYNYYKSTWKQLLRR
jgi:MoaA/NifB/PqqE/SkfB family radical SAM enzyme